MKVIRTRPQADTDIDDLSNYIAKDNLDAALRFLDAMEKTFDLISEQPKIGSLRYSHLPMLEGLRTWPVADFEKHLIFYMEHSNYIDVIRVLHGARDIPTALIEKQ